MYSVRIELEITEAAALLSSKFDFLSKTLAILEAFGDNLGKLLASVCVFGVDFAIGLHLLFV